MVHDNCANQGGFRKVTVEILQPHGFCAGVTGALRKAEALLADPSRSPGEPVWCLHELVHNELVVSDLKSKGMRFTESLDDVPPGATVLFSAHGVSPAVRRAAEARGLKVVDATCPFVTRVHVAARAFAERGLPVVVVGNANHAEVRGIVGEVEDAARDASVTVVAHAGEDVPAGHLGVVSQTTMNADEVSATVSALRMTHEVETTAEVCRATKDRQDAVKAFDGDALLVLGSANSSNTRRLCDVARCRTFRAGTLGEVRSLDLAGVSRLGVTSGASTPEGFFNDTIKELNTLQNRGKQ